jgi:hypothetical protein
MAASGGGYLAKGRLTADSGRLDAAPGWSRHGHDSHLRGGTQAAAMSIIGFLGQWRHRVSLA